MKLAASMLVALCPIACFAQPAKASNAPVAKLIRLHYANPKDIAHLLSGTVVPTAVADDALHAVVIRGNPENIANAEHIVQELDAPEAKTSARNVEITIYVIGATNKPAPQASVPQNLQSVVRQLKAVFPYSTYSLLNSILLRSREGQHEYTNTTGMLKAFPAPPSASASSPTIYTVMDIQGDSSHGAIKLSKFRFHAREPIAVGTAQHSMADVDVSTGIDLPEGQKVVVGKIDIDNGEAALFVVLSAHIE